MMMMMMNISRFVLNERQILHADYRVYIMIYVRVTQDGRLVSSFEFAMLHVIILLHY